MACAAHRVTAHRTTAARVETNDHGAYVSGGSHHVDSIPIRQPKTAVLAARLELLVAFGAGREFRSEDPDKNDVDWASSLFVLLSIHNCFGGRLLPIHWFTHSRQGKRLDLSP
jgi:hypothetical protein